MRALLAVLPGRRPRRFSDLGDEILVFPSRAAGDLGNKAEIDPERIGQGGLDARAQPLLFGLRQRSLDDEPRFDGVPARLNELISRQRRDLAIEGGAKEGPIPPAVGGDEHVAPPPENPAKHR
jgi:hypothetical protein